MSCVIIKERFTHIWNKRGCILPKKVILAPYLSLLVFLLSVSICVITYAQDTPVEKKQQMRAAFYAAQEKVSSEPVRASVPVSRKGQVYLSGGYISNHMHYKELRDDRTLDENYGDLAGYYGSLGYKSKNYITALELRPFVEGYYQRYDGMTLYDGAIIGGGAFEADQKAEIHRYGIKAGSFYDFSEKLEVFFFADLGKRIWYRGENEVVRGVTMYAEKYYWTYLGFGVGTNYRILPKFSAGAEVQVTGSLDAKMRADLDSGGTFQLGSVVEWDVKMPLKYYILKNLSFDVTPYFNYWNISESDTVEISGGLYVEPNSHTHTEGVLLGLTCIF